MLRDLNVHERAAARAEQRSAGLLVARCGHAGQASAGWRTGACEGLAAAALGARPHSGCLERECSRRLGCRTQGWFAHSRRGRRRAQRAHHVLRSALAANNRCRVSRRGRGSGGGSASLAPPLRAHGAEAARCG
jgi:hypothetical protein